MYWMDSKFPSECCDCTRNIDAGERILYDPEEHEARCSRCGPKVKPDPKNSSLSARPSGINPLKKEERKL